MARKSLLLAFSWAVMATPATAEEKGEALTAKQMDKLFVEKTLIGEYRTEHRVTDAPKFTEKFFANGTTIYKDGPINITGRWKTYDKTICYSYKSNSPLGGGLNCFWMREVDGCLYGYAYPETPDEPQYYDNWLTRSVIKGSGNSCTEPSS